MFRDLGIMIVLLGRVLAALPRAGRRRRAFAEQLHEIGNASLLMASLLSFFIGGVMSLQAGTVLVERGLGSQLGGLVGLSLCKELAPVMMAILLAGRIGSSMAAELGSMHVYQEVDALRTMNISPVEFLVLPRVLAFTIALPLAGVVDGPLPEVRQRREHLPEFHGAALALRPPLLRMKAIAGKEHGQTHGSLAGGPGSGGRRVAPDVDRLHPRQRHGDANAAEKGAAGEMMIRHR